MATLQQSIIWLIKAISIPRLARSVTAQGSFNRIHAL